MKKGVHVPTYRSWQMMKNRCLNPKAMDYKYYGGKGIGIDPAWYAFEGFVHVMGLRPEGLTLDRKDGNKHYNLSNCQWATRLEQSRNRPFTLNLTYADRSQKIWEWAKELNIKATSLHGRLWRYDQKLINLDQVFKVNNRGQK